MREGERTLTMAQVNRLAALVARRLEDLATP